MTRYKGIHIDDGQADIDNVTRVLEGKQDIELESFRSFSQFADEHKNNLKDTLNSLDFILMDLKLRTDDKNGITLLREIQNNTDKEISSVLLTGNIEEEMPWSALDWTSARVHSVLLKDPAFAFQTNDVLYDSIVAAARATRHDASWTYVNENLDDHVFKSQSSKLLKHNVRDLVGPSTGMNVLIRGATGTGKEYIAELIHKYGKPEGLPISEADWANRMKTINCAGFTDDNSFLVELFGVVERHFSDVDPSIGLINAALGVKEISKGDLMTHLLKDKNVTEIKVEGQETFWSVGHPGIVSGTLFLDEVAQLSAMNQARLLRLLDGYGFRPLGSHGPKLIPNIRFIAATNEGIENDPKGFRADLLPRLSGWILKPESLRTRTEDAKAAFKKFVEKAAKENQGSCTVENDALEFIAQSAGAGEFERGNFRQLKSIAYRCYWREFAAKGEKVSLTKDHIEKEINEDAAILQVKDITPIESTNFPIPDLKARILESTSNTDLAQVLSDYYGPDIWKLDSGMISPELLHNQGDLADKLNGKCHLILLACVSHMIDHGCPLEILRYKDFDNIFSTKKQTPAGPQAKSLLKEALHELEIAPVTPEELKNKMTNLKKVGILIAKKEHQILADAARLFNLPR